MKLGRHNSYPGKCCVCESPVPAMAGYLVGAKDSLDEAHRNGSKKWLTLCRSAVCVDVFAGRWTVEDATRRELCEDGTVVLPYDEAAVPLLQSIAKATRSGSTLTWTATRNPGDRARVLDVAKRLQLDIHPSWYEVSLDPETQALVDRARANGAFDHQLNGVEWLATRPRGRKLAVRGCILADDPGLGKSAQVLHMVPDGFGLVVVCPANAKPTWLREPGKWLPERFTSVYVCEGHGSFRWPSHPGEIVVANYEITPFTEAQIRKERDALLAKRHGVAPDPQGKTKSARLGRVGLLQDVERIVTALARLRADTSEKGKRLRVFREIALLAGWVKLAQRLHLNRRALLRNAKRKAIKAPKLPIVLALDEAHAVSNTKARRTENAMRLSALADFVVGLTGTPVERDPLKLFGLLRVCRCRVWDWDGFLDAFNGSKGEHGGTEFLREPPAPGSTARGAVVVKAGTADRLREVVLRREKHEVLDLPPKVFEELIVPVDRDLLEQLDSITRDCIAEILRGRVPTFARMAEVRKALELSRITAALERVSSYEEQDTPLVVFADHREPIERFRKRPGWGVVMGGTSTDERDRIFEAFQREDLIGVAGTIRAMDVSATLTRASNELFIGQSLSRTRNKQAQDRCHRIGTKGTVNITIMVSDHPFDQHVADLLAAKDVFVERVLNERMEYTPGGGLVAESREAWLARLPEHVRSRYAREADLQVQRLDKMRELAGI